jgi:3',5'-cyclic AMP phosphodiesterase CpdA
MPRYSGQSRRLSWNAPGSWESGSTDNGWICFSHEVGAWRLIGLDSRDPGEVAGEIESQRLAWLSAELTKHAIQATIVVMHHPPFIVQTS